jgi:hypothetical protein
LQERIVGLGLPGFALIEQCLDARRMVKLAHRQASSVSQAEVWV